ncbi:uncharacterized protein si:rp71-17i16.6 isoform X2 [Brienomyrus brachyistius]|uniref:uncharacterized protein si:rp71-17i16.6 isoform X2 n=1 Tax=Brienomyrus brachyistius TaxID=42636 RepID=UPI0020B3028B|nr:uncharacterized protein si:rp71-17i16.6 isoform X2 [Brienomyrus brachyistius]
MSQKVRPTVDQHLPKRLGSTADITRGWRQEIREWAAKVRMNRQWRKPNPHVHQRKPGSQPPRESGKELNLQQHLHRLFGRETAEYFLSPSLVVLPVSPWLREWMDQMGDQLSGERLWNTLREISEAWLTEMESDCPKRL